MAARLTLCSVLLLLFGTASSLAQQAWPAAAPPVRPTAQREPIQPLAPVAAPEADDDELILEWDARVMTGYELWREHRSAAQGGRERKEYGFFLDQARLQLKAKHDWLKAEVSVELSDAVRAETSAGALRSPPYLRDAFVDAKVSKAFRLRAGHFRRPFSRIELTNRGELPFRERGLVNTLITEDAGFGDRALGMMVWGRLPGKLKYYVAGSNAGWAADRDLEPDGLVSNVRVEWRPHDTLVLGGDYGHKLVVLPGDNDHTNAVGVDARLRSGRLTAVIDATLAQLPDALLAMPAASAPWAHGVAGYASYDVPLAGEWALQPALAAEYADANGDFSRSEAIRIGGGLNVVWRDAFRIMPQVDFVHSLKDAAADSPWTNTETYFVMLSAEL